LNYKLESTVIWQNALKNRRFIWIIIAFSCITLVFTG